LLPSNNWVHIEILSVIDIIFRGIIAREWDYGTINKSVNEEKAFSDAIDIIIIIELSSSILFYNKNKHNILCIKDGDNSIKENKALFIIWV
jgi:hypothetical protein